MQYGSLSIGLALAACLGVSGCGEKRTLGEEPVPVQRSECGGIFVLGLWRVYRLEGVWEEDVVEVRPGEWRMRRPAQLIALSAS